MNRGDYYSKSIKNYISLDTKLKGAYDFLITWIEAEVYHGHRGRTPQNRLFADGKSKLEFPDSKHNVEPSRAMDLQLYKNGKPVWDKEFYINANRLLQFYAWHNEFNLRWGGNWDQDNTIIDDQSFDDLMHWEV